MSEPDDGYWMDDDEECDHDDYDIGTLDGRCQCYRCGKVWYASDAEIQGAIDAEAEYARMMEEIESPWYRVRQWLRGQVMIWRERISWHRAPKETDEIPF